MKITIVHLLLNGKLEALPHIIQTMLVVHFDHSIHYYIVILAIRLDF